MDLRIPSSAEPGSGTRQDDQLPVSLLFEHLFESSGDAIVLLDAQDRVVRVNVAFRELFKYSDDECVGRELNGLIVDESFADEASAISAQVLRGERVRLESLRRTRDEDVLHVEISGIPVCSESAQIGIFGIYRDVTAQRNTEDLLRQSEQTYREIVESLNDGYFELNQDGVLQFCNQSLCRLMGMPDAAHRAVRAVDLIAPRFRYQAILRFRRLLRGGHGCPVFGFDLIAADGAIRHVEASLSPLQSGTGHTIVGCRGVLRDVTDRVRRDQALVEAEQAYQLVACNTGQLVYDYHLPSGRIRWLGAIEAVLGCAEEEAAAIDIEEWTRRIHPEDRGVALKMLTRAQRSGARFQSEYRFERAPGEFIRVTDHGSFLVDASGEACRLIGTMADITERYRLERELEWQARHDALTGLYNRHKFQDAGEKLLERTAANDPGHCLMYIDLDQFKVVNDTCGHHAGDELLRQLAGLLKSSVRGSDLLARLGGDEFVLLLAQCPLERAEQVAGKLIAAIDAFEFVWAGRRFQIGASIGLAAIRPGHALADALRMADQACYIAKENGRNQVHVHRDIALDNNSHGRQLRAVQSVTEALDHGDFRLYYQHIQPMASGDTARHGEILLRMLGPSGELVPPGDFIPAAERFNQIARLDRWVISQTLAGLRRASNAVQLQPGDRMSINLSGVTFGQPHFLDFVRQEFEQSGVNPNNVCFEITESSAIARLDDALDFIRAVRTMGCLVYLDDFGSGFSSFGYLKMLPVDGLKIDGRLVRGIADCAVGQAMVRGITEVAHAAGMPCVAEQVETSPERELLARIGVDYIQGYLVHRPEPWPFDPVNFKAGHDRPTSSR